MKRWAGVLLSGEPRHRRLSDVAANGLRGGGRLSRLLPLGILAALSIFLRPDEVTAQTLRGAVRDERTGQPVAGVAVIVLGENAQELRRSQTDRDGRFNVAAPGPGVFRLRFEMPGFRLLEMGPIALGDGQTAERSITLTPLAAVQLDTVVVAEQPIPRHLTDFYRRRNTRPGDFLTRAEFEKRGPSEVTDVIRQMPGFTVKRLDCRPLPMMPLPEGCHYGVQWLIETRRMPGQRCPPVLFVDGARIGHADIIEINDRVFVENLDAVEAYSGTARIPTEFDGPGSQCGVLVFWTKR